MTTGSVFLIGGGWTETAIPETWGRFVAAVNATGGSRIACVLLDDEDIEARDEYAGRYVATLTAAGAREVGIIHVSPDRPLVEAKLVGAAGIAVGGGLTPDYQKAIVASAGKVIAGMVRQGMPYAGFSAGAAIAAETAVVGGWKLPADDANHGHELPICSDEVSEDEEFLAVRYGIGLVPFAVDVHASQWGTLTRLIHAMRTGAVAEGWAIDEDTMLEVSGGEVMAVHGQGSAYHVTSGDGGVRVKVVIRTARTNS
ncbi:MAG: Type 1 glutamine amidotransferase-like domain-containing protein [Thermomicrobiales bacterium]